MNKLNILLITPWLRIGGEERSTLSIARDLQERGHKVLVMTTDGPLYPEYRRHNIELMFSNVDKRSIGGILKGARDIKKIVLRDHIQLIHTQTVVPTIMSYLAVRNIWGKRPKIIWHCRGIKAKSYFWISKLFNYIADLVIANSRHEMNKLVKNGLAPNHIKVIHNIININFPEKLVPAGNNHSVVATVSRLAPQKGIEYFLEAAKSVSRELPETRFLIVGDGPSRAALQQTARNFGVADVVEFAGFKEDMEQIYPLMDILVFPSLWEPFGNVAIEAAAYALPVIASNVGGIPEAVADGQTGVLVPPKRPDKLAESILHLLRNPDLARKMGRAGRERVRKYFTAERLISEIEDTYEHLVG